MENENAFKHMINARVAKSMSSAFKAAYPDFNSKRFEMLIPKLDALELKARSVLLKDGLKVELPESFPAAAKIISKVLRSDRLSGFQLWPVSEYIGECGLNDYEIAFDLMKELTPRFTSEFAIRPFLLRDHKQCLKILSKWTSDSNEHVRRWLSEGTRPILPWGGKVPAFIQDPTLTLPILEKLKFDEALYVRKSVANHLNDISKNHPELVVKILRQWIKDSPQEQLPKIEWIKRHALRVLIKKAHPGALKLMGVGDKSELKTGKLKLSAEVFKLGQVLEFELTVTSTAKKNQKLIVDYLIYFIKANGSLSPKVFKLKSLEIAPGEKIIISKRHPLKKITTMTFYKGKHEVSVQINGKIYAKAPWIFHP